MSDLHDSLTYNEEQQDNAEFRGHHAEDNGVTYRNNAYARDGGGGGRGEGDEGGEQRYSYDNRDYQPG